MGRRVALTLAILLSAALALGVHLVGAFELDQHRAQVAAWLGAKAGREIAIHGSLRPRWGLTPGLRAEGVEIGSRAGEALPLRASAASLDLDLDPRPLLDGRLELRDVDLEHVSIQLGPAAPEAAAGPGASPALPFAVGVERLRARDVELVYRRDARGDVVLRLDQLAVDRDGQALRFGGGGELAGVRFDLAGRLAAPGEGGAAAGSRALRLGGSAAALTLEAEGVLGPGAALAGLELNLTATARSLADISGLAGVELPGLGPLRASALLRAGKPGVGFESIDASVGGRGSAWLELRGSVQDVERFGGIDLAAEFGVADVHALAPLVRNPPDIGAIVGSATLSDLDGSLGVDRFTLRGGRKGVFEIDARGQFGDVRRVHEFDARAQLRARDLAVLGELLRTDLPAIGPVELAGHVTARKGRIATDGLRGRLDTTRLTGSLAGFYQPGGRPRLDAKLETPELHLDDVGIEPKPAAPAAAVPQAARRAPFFSDAALGLERLTRLDGSLRLRADRVVGVGGNLLDELLLTAKLAGGSLVLRPVEFVYHSGRIEASLEVDAARKPPALRLAGQSRGMRLERVLEQFTQRRSATGSLEANVELRGSGDSPRAIASSLAGDVAVFAYDGTISERDASLLTRDLLQALVPSRRKQTTQQLTCVVADFAFDGGVGQAGTLVLDASDIVVVGSGSIDLRRESLALKLVPQPRKPGLLSTAATVSVTGPLADPQVRADTASLFASAGKAVFHNVARLSGTKYVAQLLRRGGASAGPCAALFRSSR